VDIPDITNLTWRDLVIDAEWWRYTYNDQDGHYVLTAEYSLNGGGKLLFAAKPKTGRMLEDMVRFATFLPGDQAPPDETDKWSPTGLNAVFFIEPFDTWADDGYGHEFIPYTASVK
jgi:hypothetical protein